MEREVLELRTSLRTSGEEVSRLNKELAKKDNQVHEKQADNRRCEQGGIHQAPLQAPMQAPMQAPQPQPAVKSKMCSPDARLKLQLNKPRDDHSVTEPSTLQALQSSPPGSAGRDDSCRAAVGRQASASVQRQLFMQPGDDQPCISARGLSRHTSEPHVAQVQSLQVPQGSTPTNITHGNLGLATSTQLPGMRLMSAQPPRPSPRGMPTTMQTTGPLQPWRSHSQGAPVTASPRGGKAIAAVQGIESRPPAAVRAIVSEIERRSVSQTPGGASRSVEGAVTPQRAAAPLVTSGSATVRAASATAPTSSMRIQSNGPPPVAVAASQCSARGRQADDSEMMQYCCASPPTKEDSHIVFGMSPMGRPRAQATSRVRGGMTPATSPSPQGPSVQERIRLLQQRR
jgi:hypothetical protein